LLGPHSVRPARLWARSAFPGAGSRHVLPAGRGMRRRFEFHLENYPRAGSPRPECFQAADRLCRCSAAAFGRQYRVLGSRD
jgi:hypothetical protein